MALVACRAPESPVPAPPPGRFVDVSGSLETNPPFTIGTFGIQPEPVNAMFADLDEDGHDEVIVIPTNYDGPGAADFSYPTVYTFDSTRRELVPRGHLVEAFDPHPLAIIDLDGDGHLDIIDTSTRVRWGLGPNAFDAPTQLVTGSDGWPAGGNSIALDDVDDDGWLDIVGAGSRCCETCRDIVPVIATGPRQFVARADLLTPDRIVGPYSVLSSRMGPGERMLAVFGSGCAGTAGAYSFYRPTGRDADGYPSYASFDPSPPNSRWEVQLGMFDRPALSNAAPMGATVADFDADGALDLAVMINPQHTLLRGRSSWPFEDLSDESGIAETMGDGTRSMIPWGVSAFDYDADGRIDLLVTHGNDVGAFMDNAIGPQWVELYRSRGGFRFERMPVDLGLSRRGQWKSLAVGDLDNDGDPDLAVGGQGEWPRIYLNDLFTPSRSFAVRLRGTTSNHLGVGSVVEVRSAGLPLQRIPMQLGGSAWILSEPLVFATAGANGVADDVIVHWASGFDQHVGPLAAGTIHTITEPEWLAIRPASRHVVADGRATMSVRVELPATFPYDDRFAGRDVSVHIVTGVGTLAPLTRDGDVWTTTITAPSAPGASVIEVRLNGIPARIHPRVFWDAPPT
jgi:hypothetical protein